MNRTLAILATLALVACTDPAKAPAQAALQAAEAALDRLTAEVDRYAPEQARKVREAVQAARAAAGEGEWRRALAAATAAPGQVDGAVAAAAARKAELDGAWAEANRDLPNLVYAIEDRLDDLAETGAPQGGPDAPALAAARTELAAIQAGWAGVPKAVEAGDLEGGVTSASALRARATALLWRVGVR